MVLFRGKSEPRGALAGGAVSERAGGVSRPVGPVGAPAQNDDVAKSRQIDGGGKREFLVAPTLALAPNGYRRLAAADDTGWGRRRLSVETRLPGDRRVHASDVARFPLDERREHQNAKSQLPRFLRRGVHCQKIASHH